MDSAVGALAALSAAISVTTAATITGGLLIFTIFIVSLACALESYRARIQQEATRVGEKEHAAHVWATKLGAGRAGAILSLPYNMFLSRSSEPALKEQSQRQDPAAEDELVVGLNPAYLTRLKALFTKADRSTSGNAKDVPPAVSAHPNSVLQNFVRCPTALAHEYTTIRMSPLRQLAPTDLTDQPVLPVYLPTPPFRQAALSAGSPTAGGFKHKGHGLLHGAGDAQQIAGSTGLNKLYTVAYPAGAPDHLMSNDNAPTGLDQVV